MWHVTELSSPFGSKTSQKKSIKLSCQSLYAVFFFFNLISVLSSLFQADRRTHLKTSLKVGQARQVQIYPG